MDSASFAITGDLSPLDAVLSKAQAMFAQFGKTSFRTLDRSFKAVEDVAVATFAPFYNGFAKAGAAIDSFVERNEKLKKSLENVKVAAQAAWSAVFGPIGLIIDSVRTLSGTITSTLSTAFATVANVAVSSFNAVYDTVTAVFTRIASTVGRVVSTITSTFSGAFTALSSKVKSTINGIYSALTALAPLLTADVASGLSAGFSALQQDENALAKMNALLKATGGVAGFTARQLYDMAEAASEASGSFGGDAFLNAQATLLQFKNIRGDVFKDAIKYAEDFAIAAGTDVVSAADKLGRALDDPVRGMRILRSEGIIFAESEVKLVEQMLAVGKVAEAQQMILQRVAGTFGGAAAAGADTLSGKLHQLNEALDDQWKAFANALTPAIEAIIPWLIQGAEAGERFGKTLRRLTEETVLWANNNIKLFKQWYDYVVEAFQKAGLWIIDKMTIAFTYVQTAVADIPRFFAAIGPKIEFAWADLSQRLINIWRTVTAEFQNMWNVAISEILKQMIMLDGEIRKLATTLTPQFRMMSEEEQKFTLSAIDRFTKLQQNMVKPKKVEAQQQTEQETAELARLFEASKDAGGAFFDAFNQNFAENKSKVEQLRGWIMEKLGFDPKDFIPGFGAEAKDDPFRFSKDPSEGNTGSFEALEALQKRITSATAKSPESIATDGQTTVIKQHHSQAMGVAGKQLTVEEKQLAQLETLNSWMQTNGGGLLIG